MKFHVLSRAISADVIGAVARSIEYVDALAANEAARIAAGETSGPERVTEFGFVRTPYKGSGADGFRFR